MWLLNLTEICKSLNIRILWLIFYKCSYRSVPIIQQQSAITPPPYRNGRDQTFISSNSNDLRIPYEHSRTPTTSSASAASSYSAIPFRNVNDNASTPSNRAHYCASPTSLRTASGHQRERAISKFVAINKCLCKK